MNSEQNWNYDNLMEGIEALSSLAQEQDQMADRMLILQHYGASRQHRQEASNLRHTIDFIKWNMEQGEILSPSQTYLTQK